MNYNLFGDKYLEVPNEPDALIVNYYLKADATGPAHVVVTDAAGRPVRDLPGPARRGLNRVVVSLAGGGGGRGRGAGAPGAAPAGLLSTGDYTVTLTLGDATETKPAHVRDRIR
jgi:hypothetical protein